MQLGFKVGDRVRSRVTGRKYKVDGVGVGRVRVDEAWWPAERFELVPTANPFKVGDVARTPGQKGDRHFFVMAVDGDYIQCGSRWWRYDDCTKIEMDGTRPRTADEVWVERDALAKHLRRAADLLEGKE